MKKYAINRIFFIIFATLKPYLMEKLNRIKVVLVEKEISQTELAERIGKSFRTVDTYCCNRQQPSLDVLADIAKVLSVSLKDLVVETPE